VKHLLLACMRGYWKFWPRHLKRRCIYRETCSCHVYRVTTQRGFLEGCRALSQRIRTCRPGYTVSTHRTEIGLILRDGSFLPQHFVADEVLMPVRLLINQMEQQLSGKERIEDRSTECSVTSSV
jgi:uncharacterized protein